MQRLATRQSRAANAQEKMHMSWIKERGICAACGINGGVYVHHCAGSSYKVRVGAERVLIGHAFVIGLCEKCDNVVTSGSRRKFNATFGLQSDIWELQYSDSPIRFDDNIVFGIRSTGI